MYDEIICQSTATFTILSQASITAYEEHREVFEKGDEAEKWQVTKSKVGDMLYF
jgi:hypothetical protein